MGASPRRPAIHRFGGACSPFSRESRYNASMSIRQLSETMINQIAAGEVIERPASVVKELVENAVDAGATRVEIVTAGGGLGLIRVTDDGCGIRGGRTRTGGRAPLHLEARRRHRRHPLARLSRRGAAVDRLGGAAVAALAHADSADRPPRSSSRADASSPVRPAAANRGTTVEVRDLFFATPARLKFMKGERAESAAIADVVRRIAIAFPGVRFTLSGADRATLDFARDRRAAAPHRAGHGRGVSRQLASPSMRSARGAADRPCLDPVLLARQRAAAICLCQRPPDPRPADRQRGARRLRRRHGARPPRRDRAVHRRSIRQLVDVNVHPAKADVRFRDPGLVRGLDRRRDPRGAGAGRHPPGLDGRVGDAGRLPRRSRRPMAIPARPMATAPSIRAFAAPSSAHGDIHRPLWPMAARGGLWRGRAGGLRRRAARQRRDARAADAADAACGFAARRRARAGARELHHRADRRFAGHRRPARRA